MKDKRTHYGAVNRKNRSVVASISMLFVVRKTGPILPLLVGLTAGSTG